MAAGLYTLASTYHKRDMLEIGEFLADITLLHVLSGKEWNEIRCLGQKGLEALADDILRDAALRVLKHKIHGTMDSDGFYDRSDAERRLLEERFESVHGSLGRLGLAADEYHRYYKLARRQLAKERREAQVPAASAS